MAFVKINRDSAVALIAGVMLVFTGWAWGGVVLWTQFVTCGLGALALLVALSPSDPQSPLLPRLRKRRLVAIAAGLALAVTVCAIDALHLREQRASTLELIPDTTLPPVAFADWGLRGLGAGIGVALAGIFVAALRTPTSTRSALLRFPPFWIGFALFGYIAVQSLNPWGLVVERDLTWNIIPQDHISWLPAGLAAPFVGDNDPGGMNGWRQMLILSGPWMLLCALRIAVMRRRLFIRLTWVVCLNSLAVGAVGAVVASGKEFSFLGFKSWFAYHAPFGPFIYKNHAGIYLYLSAALALTLTAHLIARKGDRADRGGPHLIAGLLFVMLCLAAATTLSVGAILGAGVLLLAAPALYFVDSKIRMALSPVPALMLLGCGLIVGYVATSSTGLTALRQRIEKKQAYVAKSGTDDRAPIRRATLAQIKDGDAAKRLFGWGAGSYRWTSPPYFKQQPEFVDAKGKLWARANFAHNDWLQALLEWGVLGSVLLVAGLGWLVRKLCKAWQRRSASQLALSVGLVVVLLHATLDFALYSTPLLALIALIAAWLSADENPDALNSGR